MKIINWIGDIYKAHGYIAALVTIVMLVALVVGVAYATGVDVRDIARWIGQF